MFRLFRARLISESIPRGAATGYLGMPLWGVGNYRKANQEPSRKENKLGTDIVGLYAYSVKDKPSSAPVRLRTRSAIRVIILIASPIALYLAIVHFDSNPKVRAAFRNHDMSGMSQSEVRDLLGPPTDARDYTESDGKKYYSWDYTKRGIDRFWLVRRHKVVFDEKGEEVVKTQCYFSDDDDD